METDILEGEPSTSDGSNQPQAGVTPIDPIPMEEVFIPGGLSSKYMLTTQFFPRAIIIIGVCVNVEQGKHRLASR